MSFLKRKNTKKTQSSSQELESATLNVPQSFMDRMPAIKERIKAELSADDELYRLMDNITFEPISPHADKDFDIPTYVFIVNEGDIRPYPATQLNDREIMIAFDTLADKRGNKLTNKEHTKMQEEDRDLIYKKFFVGVDAHMLKLPREFFSHPSVKNDKLPKFLYMRVFLMYWGEPFVRNFFSLDIVDKEEKWEQLVEKNIAERINIEEELTDEKTGVKKIIHHYYQVKPEFCVDTSKPVYDINSFDFVKAEFFEQELSKMIVVAIRALYEEFDKKGPSWGWYILGFGIFVIAQDFIILFLTKDIINAVKPATGFLMAGLRMLLHI